MVKGISRQVLVVHAPEDKLFDQAIFILNDEAVGKEGITDAMLLKSADQLLRSSQKKKSIPIYRYGPAWACAGALVVGVVWALSNLL